MTAPAVRSDITPLSNALAEVYGYRVRRPDGTARTVLPRHDTGWAVFDGSSTDRFRVPNLGYSGSWTQDVDEAIEWARTEAA